jgi:hypothetical protein
MTRDQTLACDSAYRRYEAILCEEDVQFDKWERWEGFKAAYTLQEARLQVAREKLQYISDNYDPTDSDKMIWLIREALKEIGVER